MICKKKIVLFLDFDLREEIRNRTQSSRELTFVSVMENLTKDWDLLF